MYLMKREARYFTAKRKRKLLTALYLTFLLADYGEFFVPKIPTPDYKNGKRDPKETEASLEIPDHIPEETEYTFKPPRRKANEIRVMNYE